MSDFFKSKLGMVLAGIYLMLIIYSLIQYITSPPEIMSEFALLILTLPCSFLLAILFDSLGIMTNENGDSLIYIYVVIGGLINASILYLLGILITKILKFFRPKEKKLS